MLTSYNNCKRKKTRNSQKKVQFHHNNAPACISAIVMAKIHKPWFTRFSSIKFLPVSKALKVLGQKKFSINKEIIAAAEGFLTELKETAYERITTMEHQ